MKYLLLPSIATLCVLASAPAMAQTQADWTGFYVGGNLGASWGDTSLDLKLGTANGPINVPLTDVGIINQVGAEDGNKTSLTGGVQAGYNYQTGNLILGLETDFGFFDINQKRNNVYQSGVLIAPPIAYTLDQRVKTDWIWTLRPRLGYASGPWMGYITGGIATTKVKLTSSFSDNRIPQNTVSLDKSDTDTGWVGGLGGAYKFSDNLSLRGEWLYADFGKTHETETGPAGFVTITPEAKVRANIVRLGVDYQF